MASVEGEKPKSWPAATPTSIANVEPQFPAVLLFYTADFSPSAAAAVAQLAKAAEESEDLPGLVKTWHILKLLP
jgi:hypothetical protein